MIKIIGRQNKSIKNLGGKGYNLLKLDKLGLTPDFLIVSSSFFHEFIKQNNLLKYLNDKKLFTRERLKFLRKKIISAELDPKVIEAINKVLRQLKTEEFMVRSSFCLEDSKKFSYAGLFDSYHCCEKKQVFLSIKKVWASQFNERVFSYQKRRLASKFNMAIIIQEFIFPDFCGVVFFQNNKFQEILIEYNVKSFDAITSGKSATYTYLLRDSQPYISSDSCKDHRLWIEDLIEKISVIQKKSNTNLDAEFAVVKGRVYLLQVRPLTKRFCINNKLFLFGSRRSKWHIDDVSKFALYNFFKGIKLNVPRFEFIKTSNILFVKNGPYFSFVDSLKKESKNPAFINNLFRYNLDFVLRQKRQLSTATSCDLMPLILSFKNFLVKMDFINYTILVFTSHLRNYIKVKYNMYENKNPDYFIPVSTITSDLFLAYWTEKNNAPEGYDWALLDCLDSGTLEKIIDNIQSNRKHLANILNRLGQKKKKYFEIFRKLIWLYDANNYFEEFIIKYYHNKIFSVLNSLGIAAYFKDDLSKICKVPLNDINRIADGSYSFKDFKKNAIKNRSFVHLNSTFPLSGEVASKGNFQGIAKIVKSAGDIKKMTKRDILVAEYTQPSLVVAMAICRGIITEQGGLTSHAAIVARELGKPCVVGVEECTKAIKENDKIKVVNGLIYRLG